jgi:hypothetical protein
VFSLKHNKTKERFIEVHNTEWDKDMDAGKRRYLVLKSYGGDNMSAARAMQAVSNTSQDKDAKIEAAKDAKFFYQSHIQGRRHYPISRHVARITKRMPRLR